MKNMQRFMQKKREIQLRGHMLSEKERGVSNQV